MTFSFSALLPRFTVMAALFAGSALLGGCENASWMQNKDSNMPPRPALAAPDTVTLRLAEAAEKAANSLDSISRVEQNTAPTAPNTMGTLGGQMGGQMPSNSDAEDLAGAPPELTAPVTIAWTGPVEPFLSVLAQRAGYTFHTSGAKPPVPVTVTVDAYNQPLLKVIKSAALQVAGKADVVLDASRQAVEVRYAPVDAHARY